MIFFHQTKKFAYKYNLKRTIKSPSVVNHIGRKCGTFVRKIEKNQKKGKEILALLFFLVTLLHRCFMLTHFTHKNTNDYEEKVSLYGLRLHP